MIKIYGEKAVEAAVKAMRENQPIYLFGETFMISQLNTWGPLRHPRDAEAEIDLRQITKS